MANNDILLGNSLWSYPSFSVTNWRSTSKQTIDQKTEGNALILSRHYAKALATIIHS